MLICGLYWIEPNATLFPSFPSGLILLFLKSGPVSCHFKTIFHLGSANHGLVSHDNVPGSERMYGGPVSSQRGPNIPIT